MASSTVPVAGVTSSSWPRRRALRARRQCRTWCASGRDRQAALPRTARDTHARHRDRDRTRDPPPPSSRPFTRTTSAFRTRVFAIATPTVTPFASGTFTIPSVALSARVVVAPEFVAKDLYGVVHRYPVGGVTVFELASSTEHCVPVGKLTGTVYVEPGPDRLPCHGLPAIPTHVTVIGIGPANPLPPSSRTFVTRNVPVLRVFVKVHTMSSPRDRDRSGRTHGVVDQDRLVTTPAAIVWLAGTCAVAVAAEQRASVRVEIGASEDLLFAHSVRRSSHSHGDWTSLGRSCASCPRPQSIRRLN